MINNIKNNSKSQMIAIMGVILAISVFAISSLSAEIANINTIVTSSHTSNLASEFDSIKNTFGNSLNYNLIDAEIQPPGSFITELKGNIENIIQAFEQTKLEFSNIELQHSRVFDAMLERYWYPHTDVGIYNVEVTLYLDDGESSIEQTLTYSIVCDADID